MTDLANLRELLEKATKGDWAVHPLFARIVTAEHVGRPIGGSEDLATDFATYAQEICALHHPDRHRPESETLANANLIAALRNEAPALLDEVEKLRAAATQASFCLRELLPNDSDAQMTVRMLRQAMGETK